ncbi:alpha/beta hydrolase [Paenibacillus sp. 598K]|uniref:alpha/beta fold hydrolase n=1 Tax=Paenibacillus sp. 598K TaxID=1117987 RepID=UPI000FF9AD90|nr:alpha/beta hydrolase [Paenibacillus sp. 598K]GBF77582.1 alpha/beta hydrolase [Paenibacillus sp. 598K]
MREQQEHTYGTSGYAKLPDGRKLHYMTKGSGNPTVVFESGMGASRSAWGLVQPAIAEQVRAVVYDRAGFGRSDRDAAPRTLARLAEDLGGLLTALGPGPYILVGHSWGGVVVRKAAAADPERIRGLVLVDPSDEHCDMYFQRSTRLYFGMSRPLYPLLARTGLYKRMGSGPGSVQPADIVAEHHAEDFTVEAARTTAAEMKAFLDDLERLRTEPPDLRGLRATIISGARIEGAERKLRPAIMAAHRQSAEAMGGHVVEAHRSGHMVNFDEPELIVAEILRLLEA